MSWGVINGKWLSGERGQRRVRGGIDAGRWEGRGETEG